MKNLLVKSMNWTFKGLEEACVFCLMRAEQAKYMNICEQVMNVIKCDQVCKWQSNVNIMSLRSNNMFFSLIMYEMYKTIMNGAILSFSLPGLIAFRRKT